MTASPSMPSGGFERFGWIFMRVSGAALLLLALGHMVQMHLVHSVDTLDYAFVAGRYATPLWRTYDGVMLVLGLLHGFNGFRGVVNDYVKGWRRLGALWAAGLAALVLMVLGLFITFTFQPLP